MAEWWWVPPIQVGGWAHPTPPAQRTTTTTHDADQAWAQLRQLYRKLYGHANH